MASTGYSGDLEFIGYLINKKADEQPKTKKLANTVTAAIGSLVSIAAMVLTLPIQIPDWGYIIIVAITTLGTTLGVSVTKNGFSPSQIEKLKKWQAEYIDAHHHLPADTEEVVIDESDEYFDDDNRITVDALLDRVRAGSSSIDTTDLSRMVEDARNRWFK